MFSSLPLFDSKIYVYNTFDNSAAEIYDCIYHDSIAYCRQPKEPINLNRTREEIHCYHNGTNHSFADLHRKNVNISTILHKWKSSIEKVEEYSRYLNSTESFHGFICECIDPQSFGKNCEYRLPTGTTFAQAATAENFLEKTNASYVQLHGDVLSYETLQCDAGLLGLDWRDICDGVQQCMAGLDEENCDLLEFNECEDDEYRCMNGMCIPQEYFLDGQFDCLDWSDEIQYYDDVNCAIGEASIQCDDRICPPNRFSCGDGQCIVDRLNFQIMFQVKSECRSRREQYFLCETHYIKDMWTLPNGRCYEDLVYNASLVTNHTAEDKCQYIFQCDLSGAVEIHCPCGGNNTFCHNELHEICPEEFIQYPKRGIMAPYILFRYPRSYQLSPSSFWINGTIRCDGIARNIFNKEWKVNSQLHQIEAQLCQWINNNSQSLEQCCHRHNHRSFLETQPKKCISTYRIRDGFANCADNYDETVNISAGITCSTIKHYRFHCFENESTCLNIMALGNLRNDCENKFDEFWLGTSTRLTDINCNHYRKDQCVTLRQYIENSWFVNETKEVSQQLKIPFRYYCDTFWNLVLRQDENVEECRQWWVCPDEQWRCATGQCIVEEWVLDGEWDCSDGSDEDHVIERLLIERNSQILSHSTLFNRSIEQNELLAFSNICNLTIEFACFRINISHSFDRLTRDRVCLNRSRLGDGHIDCYGAIDERNTISPSNQSTMLGYHYLCASDQHSIPYWKYCFGERCNASLEDNLFWCEPRQNASSKCDRFNDGFCFDGTCMNKGRCNGIADCLYGEDEYMCEYEDINKLTEEYYRKDKEQIAKNTRQKLRLGSWNSTTSPNNSDPIKLPETTTTIVYQCNRGVGVETPNGSFACFCPPQYYGDKCEYHSDRILVLLHLNLSQSIYTQNSDINLVLKMVVLFLFENEVITNYIFHGRVVNEFLNYTKKLTHFLYSRSERFLQYKRQRYFNRSKIINEHPFSVRIEIYQRKENGEPAFLAVWQYPIYFDYLPVFRLAKVLRFTRQSTQCLNHSCNRNQTCHRLVNDRSKFLCLCKSNFTGENCSIVDQQCARGFCAPGSICKPNYRGVINGNELPYCICPFDRFGERCHLRHDGCASSPCQNDGLCFPNARPDSFGCKCTEEYQGKHCELRKPSVELYINESVEHVAAVVQYFNIDFVRLNLLLSHQELNRRLPSSLQYRHGKETAPELIIVKIYSSSSVPTSPRLYLISVQLNAQTINGTTQVNEQTECLSVSLLNSTYSPMQYHQLCQKNESLYCFEDGYYLCVCVDNNSRVECFGYDYRLDRCSECLSDGVCVKGDGSTMRNDIICVCPMCYSGSRCQFNSNSFSFTLDHLFYPDLISSNSKIIVGILILIPLFVFLIALPNNIFSLMTFGRPRCLCNGIGQYLLYMSVVNQFNLAFLCARLIHLVVNIKGLHSHSLVDLYLCKIFSYLLTTTSRMVYWFSSLVAIERVYMTLFLNGRWLRKPHLARRLIYSTMLIILISNVHELIFVESLNGIYNDKDGMCVIHFPDRSRSTWTLFHLILSTLHSILPFIINISCTLTISCLVARNKISAHKTPADDYGKKTVSESRLGHLKSDIHFAWEVVNENKELVIGPGITLIPQLFSLPLFIVSFTLYCQNLENSWMRYVLIVCYFISFVPQMTSFMLYVSPSSFYSSEWYATKMGKWFNRFRGVNTPVPAITTIWETMKQDNAQD